MKTPTRYIGTTLRIAGARPRMRRGSYAAASYDFIADAGDAGVAAGDVFRRCDRSEHIDRMASGGAILIVEPSGETRARAARVKAAPVAAIDPPPAPAPVAPKSATLSPIARRIVDLLSIGQPVLLVGPAGCGKTTAAREAAAYMGRELALLSCSAGMSESQLTGWLLPTGEAGRFEYQSSGFVRAYETGGIALLDELDAADENVLLGINNALSGDVFPVAQRYRNPHVERHSNFGCVATANTMGNGADGMYSGRNRLDAATLDRFRMGVIEMTYDRALERRLVQDEAVRKTCWAIRQVIARRKLPHVMSTRTLVAMGRRVSELGHSMAACLDTYFADWQSEDRAAAVEAINEKL